MTLTVLGVDSASKSATVTVGGDLGTIANGCGSSAKAVRERRTDSALRVGIRTVARENDDEEHSNREQTSPKGSRSNRARSDCHSPIFATHTLTLAPGGRITGLPGARYIGSK